MVGRGLSHLFPALFSKAVNCKEAYIRCIWAFWVSWLLSGCSNGWHWRETEEGKAGSFTHGDYTASLVATLSPSVAPDSVQLAHCDGSFCGVPQTWALVTLSPQFEHAARKGWGFLLCYSQEYLTTACPASQLLFHLHNQFLGPRPYFTPIQFFCSPGCILTDTSPNSEFSSL